MSSQHYRKKSSKRANEWSDWGSWVWSQTYERYYRQRQDINGNIETMWATERNTPAADAEPRREPRRPNDDQGDLAEQFSRIDLEEEDVGDEGEQEYSHRASSNSNNKQRGKSSSSKGKSKSSSSSSSKKKSKSAAYAPDGPIEEEVEEGEETAQYDDVNPDINEGETPAYPYYQTDTTGGGYRQSYQTTAYSSAYGDEEEGGDYGPEYEEARQESKREHRSRTAHYSRGESSRNQEPSSGQYARGDSSRSQDSSSRHHSSRVPQAEYASADSSAAEYGYEASEGAVTPRGPGPFDISGNEGDYEALDPRYRVEPSHKFQPGEVFKVLWPEPTGQTVGGTPTISDTQKIKNKYGESFYIGFRRFIVVANDQGHCQCVPILTYGGKGCNKRGVKAEKHGIVYDQRGRPKPLQDEPKLGFHPVRLVIEVEGESLAKASRVNYSKIVTVEHNVKVFFIGHIYPNDYQLVSDAVNVCWEDKIFQRKKHEKR